MVKCRSDFNDLTGQQFGDIKVLGMDEEATALTPQKYGRRLITWKCQCVKCGDIRSRRRSELNKIKKINKSGCSRCHGIWLVGQKFGRLTVIEDLGYPKDGSGRKLKCLCDCGKETIISQSSVIGGHTKSCGCFAIEKTIERDKARSVRGGDSIDPEYIRLYGIWSGMKDRCYNSKHNRYYRYGERGIKICDEWQDYLIFKEWALSHGYQNDLSIDRIDTNGDYEPSNCKWATREEQMNNTSRNQNITYKGRTQTLTLWCRELGLDYGRTKARIYSGFTPEEAFELPLNIRRKIRPKSICCIPGCGRYVKGHGYCQKHLQRLKKNGDPFLIQKKDGSLVRVDS